jgi:hypothetical protein
VHLQADRVHFTAERLHRRIDERFGSRGLTALALDVVWQAERAMTDAPRLAHPIGWLRALMLMLGVMLLGLVAVGLWAVDMPNATPNVLDLAGFLEAAINNVVFVGIAIAFLLTLEARVKRHRVLRVIHGLRSLAHIIDMHQLTKDPYRLVGSLPRTGSSPEPTLTAFELRRYLDYCCELLSILGKIAALYAQDFDDEVVLGAVNEVEALTTGLSRKIWQKIMVLDAAERAAREE